MWTLVLLIVFGSGYNYYEYKMQRAHYNEALAVLWNVTNAVYFYVSIVLFLCMLFKDTEFSGGIQFIILGVPLVGLLEYFSFHPANKILSKNFEKLKTGEEAANYLRYLTLLAHSSEHKGHSN